MATPADTPIQQRYTAGQCVLDVTSQPLALSRWYPQPLVQDLRFQLWLQTAVSAEPTLLAEGDRPTLQAISRYISQQVKTTLVTTHLSASAGGSGKSAVQSKAPLLQNNEILQPEALQISQPLSYLQLCDLVSVLQQCEQSIRTLPVAMPMATARTPFSVATPEKTTESGSEQSNVIPFSEARRSNNRERRAYQRRNRTRLWASSAAAALFAVGLASVLKPYSQFTPQSEQELAAGPTQAERNALPDSVNPDTASDRAVSDSAAPDRAAETDIRKKQLSQERDTAELESASVPLPSVGSALPGDSSTIAPSAGALSEKSGESDRIAASPESSGAASSDTVPSDVTVLRGGQASREGAIAPESPALPDFANIASAPSPSPTPASAPGQLSDALPTEPLSQASSPRETVEAEISAAEAPASPSLNDRLDDLDVVVSDADSEASSESVFRSQPPTGPTRAAARISEANSAIYSQIQRYFQGRWQSNGSAIDTPLRYELQLSETGEVVSFAALDENAQVYRDRLLPGDMPLRFAAGETRLQLRLEITVDGRVLVQGN